MPVTASTHLSLGLSCRAEMLEMYSGFCKQYPIITIEDPFDQDDWDNTAALTQEGVCQVGMSLQRGHLKPNQEADSPLCPHPQISFGSLSAVPDA